MCETGRAGGVPPGTVRHPNNPNGQLQSPCVTFLPSCAGLGGGCGRFALLSLQGRLSSRPCRAAALPRAQVSWNGVHRCCAPRTPRWLRVLARRLPISLQSRAVLLERGRSSPPSVIAPPACALG